MWGREAAEGPGKQEHAQERQHRQPHMNYVPSSVIFAGAPLSGPHLSPDCLQEGLDPEQLGKITPFSPVGAEALMRNQNNPHPRVMLTDAHRAVMSAAQEGRTVIDAGTGGEAVSAGPAIAPPDLSEGIEEAL